MTRCTCPAHKGNPSPAPAAEKRLRAIVGELLKLQGDDVISRLGRIMRGDPLEKGGSGSGNFGHAGRPGEVGGSGEGVVDKEKADSVLRSLKQKEEHWAWQSVMEHRFPELFRIPLDSQEQAQQESDAICKELGIKSAKILFSDKVSSDAYADYAANLITFYPNEEQTTGRLVHELAHHVNHVLRGGEAWDRGPQHGAGFNKEYRVTAEAFLRVKGNPLELNDWWRGLKRGGKVPSQKSLPLKSTTPLLLSPKWDERVVRATMPVLLGVFKAGGDEALGQIRKFPRSAKGMAWFPASMIEGAERVEWKGGAGSGNFGHEGRPGEVGGSGDHGITTIAEFRQVNGGIGSEYDVEGFFEQAVMPLHNQNTSNPLKRYAKEHPREFARLRAASLFNAWQEETLRERTNQSFEKWRETPVTIYRGVFAEGREAGQSWTFSKQTAEVFSKRGAARFSSGGGIGKVIERQIVPDRDIFYTSNAQGEAEILLQEKSLSQKASEYLSFDDFMDRYMADSPVSIASWIDQPEVVQAAEREAYQFAQQINQTTADALREVIVMGMENGDSIKTTANRISNLSDEWAEGWRAEMIARTETARVYTSGRIEAWRATGVVKRKVWSATDDACPFCRELDGTVVGLDEPFFKVGQSASAEWEGQDIFMDIDYMDVDGPPLHPACRCAVVAELDYEALDQGGETLEEILAGDVSKSFVEEKGEGSNGEEGRWITSRGRHIFIAEGQTLADALDAQRKKEPREVHPNSGVQALRDRQAYEDDVIASCKVKKTGTTNENRPAGVPFGAVDVAAVSYEGKDVGFIWKETSRSTHTGGGRLAIGFSYDTQYFGISKFDGKTTTGFKKREKLLRDLLGIDWDYRDGSKEGAEKRRAHFGIKDIVSKSVKAKNDEGEEGRWVTMRGRRVFIREGQDPAEALQESLDAMRPDTPATFHPGPDKENPAKGGKWMLANGKPLPEHVGNIRPDLTNVRVSMDPEASMIWIGKDSAGRDQKKYKASVTDRNKAAKFARTHELIEKKPSILKENEGNLTKPETAEEALVTKLIFATGMRPGSTKDTKAEKQAYGATTLLAEHVKKSGDGVVLAFVGKSGKDLTIPVEDRSMVKVLLERKARGGKLFGTSEAKVLGYVHGLDGGKFKTKDIRTAVGTETALNKIKQMPAPKSMKEYKAAVKEVAVAVSTKLGNTPTIALQSYISPVVFAPWRQVWEGEKLVAVKSYPSFDKNTEVQFGEVEELPDWRKVKIVDDEDPDDEELEQTPQDVVEVLGFDPLEFETETETKEETEEQEPKQ